MATVQSGVQEHLHTVTGGQTYWYKIVARNYLGLSEMYSTPVSVWTAQAPEKPAAPTTEIVDVYVKIQWTEPIVNNMPITGYKVLLQV